MHRSPLCALMLCAALAACSTRDDSRSTELLSQDSTLVARLDVGRDARAAALPDTCRAIVATARPAVVNKPRADTLTRRAYDAEILGNVEEARTLLRRASDLDGTNKATEYHLGRTNEALGDRGAAIAAYCRYLTLTPTATESAEARQRVASLSQAETKAVAGGASDSVATGARARVAKLRAETTPPVTTTPVRAQPATTRAATRRSATRRSTTPTRVSTRRATRERAAEDPRVVGSGTSTSTTASTTTTTVAQAAGRVDSTSSGGDVIAISTRDPVVDQPSTDSRAASRGPSRTQSAGIGAAAGAIIGAATGRGVRGAVIGAAAGGILGGAMGGRR